MPCPSSIKSKKAVDSPHVGKHLKDHLMVPLFFPAPGVGVTMHEMALSMGPAALRGPGGPLPSDPSDDVNLSAELQAMKQEAERRFTEWDTTGCGLLASSLVDAVVFCSTGLGDTHSHDAEIFPFATAGNDDLVRLCLNIDTSRYFDDARHVWHRMRKASIYYPIWRCRTVRGRSCCRAPIPMCIRPSA